MSSFSANRFKHEDDDKEQDRHNLALTEDRDPTLAALQIFCSYQYECLQAQKLANSQSQCRRHQDTVVKTIRKCQRRSLPVWMQHRKI
jgi:hypothetical protein